MVVKNLLLTAKQARMLRVLTDAAEKGESAPGKQGLAALLDISRSAVGPLLAYLEQEGWIRQESINGIGRIVEIVATGQKTASPKKPLLGVPEPKETGHGRGKKPTISSARYYGPVPAAVVVLHPIVKADVIPRYQHLNLTGCKWPIGDPAAADFNFCGAERHRPLSPYCNDHHGRAYSDSGISLAALLGKPKMPSNMGGRGRFVGAGQRDDG